jgi:Uma2 family endonuclease
VKSVEPERVIEVLSPSTETLDRHKKSEIYRTMPSIEEDEDVIFPPEETEVQNQPGG